LFYIVDLPSGKAIGVKGLSPWVLVELISLKAKRMMIMDTLLFGISGLPLGNGSTKFNYASGID